MMSEGEQWCNPWTLLWVIDTDYDTSTSRKNYRQDSAVNYVLGY